MVLARKHEKNHLKLKIALYLYVVDAEPTKKPKVVWPGEFENQLRKRNRNLEKIDERENNRLETPAIHTPSDTQSLISNEEDAHSTSDLKPETPPDDKVHKVEKKEPPPKKSSNITPISISDTHFMDEFLEPPKKLNPTSSGGSFFLVSSNLVVE
eukprot:NP_508384.1 Uncharacterized protein CELE_F49H12.2 [Caenorhabditis elegans]